MSRLCRLPVCTYTGSRRMRADVATRGIEERADAEVVDESRQCGVEVGSRPVAPQRAARHGVTGLRVRAVEVVEDGGGVGCRREAREHAAEPPAAQGSGTPAIGGRATRDGQGERPQGVFHALEHVGDCMPTILRIRGYRIGFYQADLDEPPHVHVRRQSGEAKFWLLPVRLAANQGFRPHKLADIARIFEDFTDDVMAVWAAEEAKRGNRAGED